MDTLYVVMPAYNEKDNIEEVVSSWYPVLEGKNPASRLVVADSGSTDGTHEILEEMQEEADGIAAAVASLKELLGGIEL